MSELESSTNNQLPPPSYSTLPTTPLPPPTPLSTRSDIPIYRDLRFYYPDGSVVLLVRNVLFKVHASLLAAEVKDYELKHVLKFANSGCEGNVDRPGANDAHPIVLPADVTAAQFRDFLMVVYGGATSNAFLSFLDALQTPSYYRPFLVSRLIKIGYLACRFGMKRLDTWSQARLYTITEFASKNRLMDDWNTRTILQLVQYTQAANATSHRPKLLDRMRHIISTLVMNTYGGNNEIPQGNIIDICTALYKRKDILIHSPGFFGFIFAVIISLGHQSPAWTNHLTREDRRVLYVAYASFTRLANHADLQMDWVIDPDPIKEVCWMCLGKFDAYWGDSFSQCEGLVSHIPLVDIRHIVSLPEYQTRFWLASRTPLCDCARKMMGKIGQHIETVYCALAEKYKLLAQTA